MVDLQLQSGIHMGVGLRSQFSATEIIDHIAREMRSTVFKTIVQNKGKVSILIDETTVSDRSRTNRILLYY